MAKKPDISSKKFSELLLSLSHQPDKILVKKIDSRMFPLDHNLVFSYKPEQLAFKEYKRCFELFQKRNPGLKPLEGINRIAGIQSLIAKAEAPIRKQLEELAVNTIKNIYHVPDYVDLKGIIYPRIDLDTEQDNSPNSFLELTLSQKNKMREEIQKRIILNGLCHGSSLHIWKGIYHLVSVELDKLNPQLKELYDYYTSNLGIAIWNINPDSFQSEIDNGTQITQGYNKLQFDRQKGFGGQVQAKGINFPVLLHEINKGVVDWLVSAGIPNNYTNEELTYYYSKSDSYQNEVYHYLLSPSLWAGLLETAQVSNEDLPKLISRLTKLNYQELVDLFRLIQDNKEEATKKINGWIL